MTSEEIRKSFLEFFEKREHKILPSVSLISPDPTVLFTTAGMQPLTPYLAGEKDPLKDFGTRHLASCQKCFRTNDILEVGDDTHHTFFEMLGNWSIGVDENGWYFKEGAIELALDFLLKELKLKKEKISVSVFKGDDEIPRDEEAIKIWQKFGIKKIMEFSREDNFWGPVGEEGPCGPCSEIYYQKKNGRLVEVWNLVFMEYYREKNGKFRKLNQTNVDTGIGFERLVAILEGKESAYESDLFLPILEALKFFSQKDYETKKREFRIILDHLRASCFLIADGVLPSNLAQGYVLRRILRRLIRYGKIIEAKENFILHCVKEVIEKYKSIYPELFRNEEKILSVIQNEKEKFEKTLEKGLKEFKIMVNECKSKNLKEISGKVAFDLYQSYGFPLELTLEIANEEGLKVDVEGFQKEFRKHQMVSRKSAKRKFGGHGIEEVESEEDRQKIKRLHTAAHLLHQALREILGTKVRQMGSDITPERLRFDFYFERALTKEEIEKVENLVNQKIKEDLEVKYEKMPLQQALKSGALAFFKEKYPDIVTVYTIGNFSKEICGGPHVQRTSEVGKFKILKEEGIGSNLRRIRAKVE